MHFPADRDQLVKYARMHGADQDLLDRLRLLPERSYAEPNEVGRAFAELTGR
ncbi:MAG TPA: DUF2795 domain-containing protein [Actinophytocola sp.]|uniref:DUF2795 domain-containing protein n=1 Tax=Actinophytocola sp. TaxID=1872138 RepID=UPI002DDD3C9C|nr:DUF2795 domain-containing protein [Actinophytocola sp.]HEV2778893.1 DUF2795 domain-containing protein [Actinophytocola sp.]